MHTHLFGRTGGEYSIIPDTNLTLPKVFVNSVSRDLPIQIVQFEFRPNIKNVMDNIFTFLAPHLKYRISLDPVSGPAISTTNSLPAFSSGSTPRLRIDQRDYTLITCNVHVVHLMMLTLHLHYHTFTVSLLILSPFRTLVHSGSRVAVASRCTWMLGLRTCCSYGARRRTSASYIRSMERL